MKNITSISILACSVLILGLIFGNVNTSTKQSIMFPWISQDNIPSNTHPKETVLHSFFQLFQSPVTIQSYAAPASNTRTSHEQILARAINGEARGEPYEGQVAVGAVILNRTRDTRFPHTIPGVIYQPGAFTAVSDGQINVPIQTNSTVVKAARDALNGWDPSSGCVYYWNPSTATSKWIWSRTIVKKIGKHYFGK